MKFRRKPVVEVAVLNSWSGKPFFWHLMNRKELINDAVPVEDFKELFEPIDAEARAAWKEVYGEGYDDTSS